MKVLSVHAALDQLAPRQAFDPEWEDVLERAGSSVRSPRDPELFRVSRRVVLALAVLACVLIPLGALAAANDWWFLRLGDAPAPATDVTVVRTGSWGSYEWQLVAYRTAGDDICFSFTPTRAEMRGEGAAMSCASIEEHGITFLSGSTDSGARHYLVGPVLGSAREVAVELADGSKLRTRTFAAPESLGSLRFYATELPTPMAPPRPSTSAESLKKLVGVDAEGEVVACLDLSGAQADSQLGCG